MVNLKSTLKRVLHTDLKVIKNLIGVNVNQTRRVVYGGILASFATILQSTGMLGGVFLIISALSTLPIILSTTLSIHMGFLSYVVASVLIAIIQPSELFAFPFTTGLLGLSLGVAFLLFKKTLGVVLFSGISLTLGIFFILAIIQFPILGPSIASTIDLNILLMITIFSLIYSWLWVKIFIFLVRTFKKLAIFFYEK
ncbi:hypothetical protein [Litchfieldia alkalitelluris]|uniref:hypothetical protein n=1 Tax=Litchfieldia alkalitelluris TaxID=304268 RepID=UPI000997627D|nr:hypothetical protein [Litchfieldia alkalitelluris]